MESLRTSLVFAALIAWLGVCLESGCSNSTGPPSSVPEWYPSTISGYEPYILSLSTGAPVPLKPGLDQTSFTEDEIVRYTGEFIDQRQELIGADSKALRLVSTRKSHETDSLRAEHWRVAYEQIDGYQFETKGMQENVGQVDFGSVSLIVNRGEVYSLNSWVMPVVPVPEQPIVSNEAIRESLIGEKMTYLDWGGNPIEYEVKEDESIVFKDIVVFPTLREDTLEVRLCREVDVGEVPNWTFFYDVITGEKIYVRMNTVY